MVRGLGQVYAELKTADDGRSQKTERIFKMAHSPCGGCPPCCKSCVFSASGSEGEVAETVVSAADYGCVKGEYPVVKTADGTLAQERDGALHRITSAGAQFLRETGNPLSAFC